MRIAGLCGQPLRQDLSQEKSKLRDGSASSDPPGWLSRAGKDFRREERLDTVSGASNGVAEPRKSNSHARARVPAESSGKSRSAPSCAVVG